MIKRRIEYSSRIDVQEYGYFRFMLEALKDRRDDIEISVDYGPSKDTPGAMTANVWARKPDGTVKTFLFAADVPSPSERSGYAEIAKWLYHAPDFQPALLAFLEGHLGE